MSQIGRPVDEEEFGQLWLPRYLSRSEPACAVNGHRAPLTTTKRAVKRALDIMLAWAAIILLLPLLVIVAIAIKLDSSGPIIFRQRRVGFNGNQFVIFKFRTMTTLEDGQTIMQARRGDPRVTRVGRLLRRFSIDELPQLFNVLKSDMSLVGPRPHALAHDKQYMPVIAEYAFRHHIKPGLTGWAQVNRLRGETRHVDQMTERLKFDLCYINHWSLSLDVYILVKTCVEVLRKPAY
jgi:exopolysaccharide biosynthesis polyprenyl glycosylphosphotransferase